MRHRKDHRKLSRTRSHRRALLRNLVTSLFQHERIETTVAKAKEARRLGERMITFAKRGRHRRAPPRRALRARRRRREEAVRHHRSVVRGAQRRLHAHHPHRPPARRRRRDRVPRAGEVARAEGKAPQGCRGGRQGGEGARRPRGQGAKARRKADEAKGEGKAAKGARGRGGCRGRGSPKEKRAPKKSRGDASGRRACRPAQAERRAPGSAGRAATSAASKVGFRAHDAGAAQRRRFSLGSRWFERWSRR